MSLCIICIIDLPFLMLAGYAVSIQQVDFRFLIVKNVFYDTFGLDEIACYGIVNVFNSFVWAKITVLYLANVFRFHKDKTNKDYPWHETLEYLSIPERLMASPRDIVLYFHIFAFIACITIYKYLI